MSINAINGNQQYVPLIKVNDSNAEKEEVKVFDNAAKEVKDWLKDNDKICTDGNDDGKLSTGEALKSFGKGLLGIIKTAVNHPIATGLTVAGGVALTVATGGAALPFIVAAGATVGAGEIGYGVYKAATAKTDGEAKQAFETMGNGTFALGTAALSSGAALKAAQGAGVSGIEVTNNPVQNLAGCFKAMPDAAVVSKANVVTNVTGVVQPNSTILRNGYEGFSKAADTEVYRFNPNGTQEEVLVNNPNVSFDADAGKYYVQTSWGEKAYIDTNKEYLIAKYSEGDYNAIAGDIFQETYVDGTEFHATGTRNYLDPSQMQYGKEIIATKQAPAKFAIAPEGTTYNSLEGTHTLEADSVIMVDAKGNPYQNTITNLLKRNEFSNEAMEALENTFPQHFKK